MSQRRSIRKAQYIGLVVLVIVLVGIGTILLFSYQRTQEVVVWELFDRWEQIQSKHSPEAKGVILELLQRHESSMPILRYALTKEETLLNSGYRKLYQQLPVGLRQKLPQPQDPERLRRIVLEQLYFLGPFSRPLVSAIAAELPTANSFDATALLRSLYWSLPESRLAQTAFAKYLATPSLRQGLFGSSDAAETWGQLGHLAPQVALWLSHPTAADEAADALGHMGPAGRPYVEQIVEVAQHGILQTNKTKPNHFSFFRPRDVERNRGYAVMALGRLGVASSSVLETLASAWTHTNQIVRAQAAIAIQNIGPAAAPIVSDLVNALDFSEAKVLTLQFQALARIGPEANEAVPQLTPFLSEAPEDRPSVPESRTLGWHTDDLNFLPLSRAAAYGLYGLGHTDNPRIFQLLSEILGQPMNLQYEKTRRLLDHLAPIRSRLIPLAEARLGDPSDRKTLLLAGNLLYLDREHKRARGILVQTMTTAPPQLSNFATRQFYLATQETATVLPVFRKNLQAIQGTKDQLVLQAVRNLGSTGGELADLIRPMLFSEDPIVRNLAGKALLDLAPEKLPPLAEE